MKSCAEQSLLEVVQKGAWEEIDADVHGSWAKRKLVHSHFLGRGAVCQLLEEALGIGACMLGGQSWARPGNSWSP